MTTSRSSRPKEANVRDIPLAHINEPAFALRAEIDDQKLDELCADIRDNGLYYPIIVHAVGERFEIRDGHRRFLAHKRLQLISIRCIIHDENSPPPEAVKLKCNLLREDNTDAEIAVWIHELATHHNWSLAQIVAAVGRSENWVNERVDLLRGDPRVLVALGERRINFSQAKAINKCPEEVLRGMALHFAEADNLPAWKLNEWLQRQNYNLNPNPAPAVIVQVAPNDGAGGQPGIVCDWCGGYKDPQNMVQVWLHRWEWEQIRSMLEQIHANASK